MAYDLIHKTFSPNQILQHYSKLCFTASGGQTLYCTKHAMENDKKVPNSAHTSVYVLYAFKEQQVDKYYETMTTLDL